MIKIDEIHRDNLASIETDSYSSRTRNKTKYLIQTTLEDVRYLLKDPHVEMRLRQIILILLMTGLYAVLILTATPADRFNASYFAAMFIIFNGLILFVYVTLKRDGDTGQYFRFARIMLRVAALALMVWILRIIASVLIG